jgi:LDH2 family malate/lactate/ureidoglycolate dehydrogenase
MQKPRISKSLNHLPFKMKAILDRLMETNRASMENHGIMLLGGAQKRINEMRIRTEKRPRMMAEAETLAERHA